MKTIHHSGRIAGYLFSLLVTGMGATAFAQTTPTIVWQSAATNNYILNPVALSPDGTVAATLGSDNTVEIWRMTDGVPQQALSGNGSWVGGLAFSPNGSYLASSGGDDTVRVWRTANWSPAYTIPTAIQGAPVAFSPDSATLAIGNAKNIELRHATNGSLFQSWTATTGSMAALAFSPDGSELASGAGARGTDTNLKLWSVTNGTPLHSIATAQTYGVGRIVFSPDGLQVLTSSELLNTGPLQSWRVSDGTLLRTFPLAAVAAAFSADGTVLAAVGTNIMFFRVSDGAVIQNYTDPFDKVSSETKGIAIAPAGGLFVRSREFGQVLTGLIPVLISTPTIQAGQLSIQWVGGTGRYQLQSNSGLGDGWQDDGGILTNSSTVTTPTPSNAFYRVVALPP
jgi:WD40 repeat protein